MHCLTVEGPSHLWVSGFSSSLTRQGLLFSHKLQETRAPSPQSIIAGPGLIWLLRTRISENFDFEVGIPSSDFVPSSPLEQRGTQVWPMCNLHDQCVQDGVPGTGV